MSAAGSAKYRTRELTLRRLVFLGAKLNFETVEGGTAYFLASRRISKTRHTRKALGADVDLGIGAR